MVLGFLFFWGIAFTVATTVVALVKHETDQCNNPNEPHFDLIDTYKLVTKILFLPSVWSMAIILLTVKVRCTSMNNDCLNFIDRNLDWFCCCRCHDWIRINRTWCYQRCVCIISCAFNTFTTHFTISCNKIYGWEKTTEYLPEILSNAVNSF